MADDEYKRTQDENLQNDNLNVQNQLFASNFNNIDKNDNEQIQLLNVRNFNPIDNNGSDNSSNQVKRDFNFKSRDLSMGSGSSGSKAKKRKSGTAFYKKLNRAKLKHSKIKKVRPNYAVCYKW